MAQLIDASGVVVFEGDIIGQPFTVVRLPIAFDTPGLVLTGIPIYTFAAGDYVPGNDLGMVSVTTPWDGTTPVIHIRAQGGTDYAPTRPLDNGNGPADNGGEFPVSADDGLFGGFGVFIPGAGVVLEAMVDDGAGGDPGSIVGVGELVLVFIPGTA